MTKLLLATLAMVLLAGGLGPCLAEDKPMDRLWEDLRKPEPAGTQAALALAKTPEETTAFLAGKLAPLALSKERLGELLVQLASEDERRWQEAFRELDYHDPRLAANLEEIMANRAVQDHPARQRLVDLLAGRRWDEEGSFTQEAFTKIALEKVGADGHNFRVSLKEGGTGAFWAEGRVERLCGPSAPKPEWTRAIRALAVLESIGTEQATAVIDAMASGHPDALPTKVAEALLAKQAKR